MTLYFESALSLIAISSQDALVPTCRWITTQNQS